MSSCIQLCPPEIDTMIAHDLEQEDSMKMEIQGEGNHASSMFSDTRDEKTVHGLTLSPKIQSSNPWVFDAAGAFGDQDLDTLLGPVQFDLIAEEARRRNLDIDALFNDEYQIQKPPAKKRKFTREPSKKPKSSAESVEPVCEQGLSPLSTSSVNQAPTPLPPVVYHSPYSHAVPVYHSPYSNVTFVYNSLYGHAPSGNVTTQYASIQSVRPSNQANGSARAAEKFNLQEDSEVGQSPVQDSRGEESAAPVLDSFDDDGSLFGDYVSSRGCIECSPVAEPSFENKEVELRGTQCSATPAVSWDPDVPIPSVERDLPISNKYYHTFQLHPINMTASKPSTRLSTSKKIGVKAFPGRSLQNSLDWSQNRASVSEQNHRQRNTPSTLPYCRPSLPLCVAIALATPDNVQSVEQTVYTARRNFFTQCHPPQLPPPATNQVPAHLANLLESLYQKFNSDQAFRTSTITWLVSKMASSQNHGQGDESESQRRYEIFLRDIQAIPTREGLERRLIREMLEHEHQEMSQNDVIISQANTINNLQEQVQYWESKARANPQSHHVPHQTPPACYQIPQPQASPTPIFTTSVPNDQRSDAVFTKCQHPSEEGIGGICGNLNSSIHVLKRSDRSEKRVKCWACHKSLDIKQEPISRETYEKGLKLGLVYVHSRDHTKRKSEENHQPCYKPGQSSRKNTR